MLAEILSAVEKLIFSRVCLYVFFFFTFVFICFSFRLSCVLYVHVVQGVCSWCAHVYGECSCMFYIVFAMLTEILSSGELVVIMFFVVSILFSLCWLCVCTCILYMVCSWCVHAVYGGYRSDWPCAWPWLLVWWMRSVVVSVCECVFVVSVCVCVYCICVYVHVMCMFMTYDWQCLCAVLFQFTHSLFVCGCMCVFSAEPWLHSHLLTG